MQCAKETLELELYSRTEQVKNGNYILGEKLQSWALLPESTAKRLRRDLVRIRKGIDRLLTAYQEGLLPIEELRERMPGLRRREHAHNAQLQAIVDQSVGRAASLTR
jgi:hypothetical protein